MKKVTYKIKTYTCICPTCEKRYKRKMAWIDKHIKHPRKRCNECKQKVMGISE